jgi:hypothetical protein
MAHAASWENFRAKMRGLAIAAASIAIALSPFMSIYNSQAHAGEASDTFPFLIYCKFDGTIHGLYLSRIQPDGLAVYDTPDKESSLSIIITLNGKAEPVGGDWSGNCKGKTLEQLRSAGQVHD